MNPAIPTIPSPYGPEVDGLAAISGLDPDTTALEVAAVLGGLAGPTGGLICWGGEWQPVRFHLALTGRDEVRHGRLLGLLTEPARLIQEGLRHHSAAVVPKVMNEMEQRFGFPAEWQLSWPGGGDDYLRKEAQFNERMTAWSSVRNRARASLTCQTVIDPWQNHKCGRRVEGRERFPVEEVELSRDEARALREPTLLSKLSSAEGITKILAESDRQWLLGLDQDGHTLRGLLADTHGKSDQMLAGLLAGTDLPLPISNGVGSLRRATLTLISILGPEGLDLSDSPSPAGLPGWPAGTLLLGACPPSDPGPDSSPAALGHREAADLYSRYRLALNRLLMERRNGGTFTQLGLCDEEALRLRVGQQEFVGQLETIEPELRRFSRGLAHLPGAILFALKALTPLDESRDLVEASLGLAHRAMNRHLTSLGEAFRAREHHDLARQKEIMLRKLIALSPCPFRDLLRSYPKQRKALHEPVLEALIVDGRVERTREGMLRAVILGSDSPAGAN